MELQVAVPDELMLKLRAKQMTPEMIQTQIITALRLCADVPDEAKTLRRRAEETELQTRFDVETRKIVEILKQANPVKIIRFGSAARGDLRWKSDLDLCVILERPAGTSRFEMNQELRFLLDQQHYRYEVPVEFHTYTPTEFENLRNCDNAMVREIVKGEVVYERG